MSNETYSEKAITKTTLEQAVRDYIQAAKKDGDDSFDILEEIKNAVYDGSEKEFLL